MNQRERKSWLLQQLASGRYDSVFTALKELGGELSSLEAVPFGLRNRPTELCVDLTEGKVDGEESVKLLAAYVQAVPDEA